MKRGFASVWLGAIVAAAAVAGCAAGGEGSARGEGRQVGAGEVRDLTDAEQIVVDRATQLLVRECMEEAGFRYWPEPVAGVDERRGGGYVLDDVGWARRHGYGTRLQEKALAAQKNDRNHAYANALPEARRVRYSKTLDGDPSAAVLTVELPAGGTVQTPRHGCRAEAKGTLYGDFPAWFRAEKTATNLTPLYVPDLLADERFGTARTAWSACMRARGHDYADPARIRERLPRLTRGLSEAKAHAVEVELAVAEARCATEETSLVRTARALEREYRGGLREYRDDVADHRRMQHAALERAEELCGPAACDPDS